VGGQHGRTTSSSPLKRAKTMARTGVACLIIDPQNSFHAGGTLAVPGSDDVSRPSSSHKSQVAWQRAFRLALPAANQQEAHGR